MSPLSIPLQSDTSKVGVKGDEWAEKVTTLSRKAAELRLMFLQSALCLKVILGLEHTLALTDTTATLIRSARDNATPLSIKKCLLALYRILYMIDLREIILESLLPIYIYIEG